MISPASLPGSPTAHRYVGHFSCATAFLLGIGLPTSNFIMNLSMVLAVICLLLSRDTRYVKVLAKNPLIWLPALMVVLLAISLLWHHNLYGKVMVSKYSKLLYILPLAMFFVLSRSLVSYFAKGFLLANAVILAASLWVGVLHMPLGHIDPLNPSVFKLQITHNFFMALAAVIWLSLAFRNHGLKRWGYALLVCLAIYNIVFMVQGRTGYVALAATFGVWGLLSLSTRQRLGMVVCALVVGAIVVMVPNRAVDRLHKGVTEIQTCLAVSEGNADVSCDSSMGLRTAFALESIKLIENAPILGHGAGGFWYKNNEADFYSINPHNEYLMQTVQSGIVGLALFLGWMWCFFLSAWRLPTPIRNVLVALLGGYLACHLFNSFLLDSSEGHLFIILTAIVASYSVAPPTKEPPATGQTE
ncbi:putative inner membrane protein [Yersinia frederiksenii]|uniref:O-Antigen ligase family protein n=2 Tax=Yersinia frederiksenii TaxID=29484 RepID=A0ABR4W622_YERFR|nr:O-antigen biosynthesis protein [Yersinia frederiksenii ATCC 33641]CFQ92527.1 putative inner membrane protein [Yersinia frederiksenii]KGA47707.1 O-Antigen ligase family protein [Yersinia frederiksenii ATCC 33641]CNB63871.1 putative inner membrane protein [Yersinia frederiksenii]CNF35258.1 putative inner membrane protein [Yersinia frederiksenii]